MVMSNDNILNPELVWIDGRCYRFNESSAWSKERGTATYQEESTYLENDYDSGDDEPSLQKIDIEATDGGNFKHSFYCPKQFFAFLVGPKGLTRKKLEMETSTSIQIPRLGQDGDIVLIGQSRKKIKSARYKIDDFIRPLRTKLRITHFLSIPANGEDVRSRFEKFKESVLKSDMPMQGVEESIFQNPHKLHLTLGVLWLLDDSEKEKAVRALEHCNENIIKPIILKNGPILLTIRGVDYMNDDPANVAVLYGKVHSNNDVLQSIANEIVNYFVEIGLAKLEIQKKVKLHMTLMNTKFKNDENQASSKRRDKFDARNILEAHKDTKFGEFIWDSIHISQFRTVASDGFYDHVGKIMI
ncbi:activating signal cointegrator 1 complex subunit 1 isoform X1 [Athalia rosae]|uniref:activating signal cointegrator 1 complex subunit 1 isoform X1 n=2 Tax=Athalia rosae TaxID=37344 RepID=UPI00203420AD|nr:activating signal cointegrator 1 complex subunit 1 isoform X1 [Athalia rosae]